MTTQELYEQRQLWQTLAKTTYDLELLEALWQKILLLTNSSEKIG